MEKKINILINFMNMRINSFYDVDKYFEIEFMWVLLEGK